MDFTLEILLGVATGSFGFALGIGFKNFAIPRIKESIFNLVSTSINSYVAGFLQNLQEHPEQAEALIKPFIDAFSKSLAGPGEEKGERSFKIGGFKVPGFIVNKAMEMILGNLTKKQNSGSLLELPS